MSDVSIADPVLDRAERRAVAEVMESGRLAAGAEVDAFEAAFADRSAVDHCVATANGTAALHTALAAAGVGEGDAVVTTPLSFVATANAIRFVGAKPVFADVDPTTFNLDPDAVETVVRRRSDVEALLPVHLYGLPAPMGPLRELADAHDLVLIEDAAQAHSARYRGRPVGSIGDVGCFSFYPTKNMTTGEGGMITTDDPAIADGARRFIDHGRPVSGDGTEHVDLGHNFRMTNLSAAIGRVQLDRLDDFVETRRANAAHLDRRLADTPVITPAEPPETTHVYHQYTVRVGNRTAVRKALADEGIQTGVYYPNPIHDQPAYDTVTARAPVAEQLAEEVLSLPVHPNVGEPALDRIGRILAAQADAPGGVR